MVCYKKREDRHRSRRDIYILKNGFQTPGHSYLENFNFSHNRLARSIQVQSDNDAPILLKGEFVEKSPLDRLNPPAARNKEAGNIKPNLNDHHAGKLKSK